MSNSTSNEEPVSSKKWFLGGFFKKDSKQDPSPPQSEMPAKAETPQDQHPKKISTLWSGLKKTKHRFLSGITTLFSGKSNVDLEVLDQLETHLITSDFGIQTTETIILGLKEKLKRKELMDMPVLMAALKKELIDILNIPNQTHPQCEPTTGPLVTLVVGVNGVGKTTTVGKLAHYFKAQNKSVLLAAGDTFRAAAVEQLKIWGERNQLPVISQGYGADSASVLYDAYESAKAKKIDVVLADTAGRLHNKENLMNELKKIKKVLSRFNEQVPQDIILVLDASIGQNSIRQAKLFHEAVGLTGLIITKLDGTAKGGIVFDLAKTIGLPIKFLGFGEGISDLKAFNSQEFIQALFEDNPLVSTIDKK